LSWITVTSWSPSIDTPSKNARDPSRIAFGVDMNLDSGSARDMPPQTANTGSGRFAPWRAAYVLQRGVRREQTQRVATTGIHHRARVFGDDGMPSAGGATFGLS
jgi:hypothetical protein